MNLLALSFGAILSELVKARSRSIEPMKKKVGDGPTMYDLMKFKDPSMSDLMKFSRTEFVNKDPRMPMMGDLTQTEIRADLIKWFIISLSLSSTVIPSLEDCVSIGAVAGLLSQVVRERSDNEVEKARRKINRSIPSETKNFERDRKDFLILRFARSSLETAVQLLTYEASREYVQHVAPYFTQEKLQSLFGA